MGVPGGRCQGRKLPRSELRQKIGKPRACGLASAHWMPLATPQAVTTATPTHPAECPLESKSLRLRTAGVFLGYENHLVQEDNLCNFKRKTYGWKLGSTIPKFLSNKVPIEEKIFWNLKLGKPVHNLNGGGRKKTNQNKVRVIVYILQSLST